MIQQRLRSIAGWVRPRWRQILAWGAGGLAGVFLLMQLAYPTHLMVPFQTVDGRSVGQKDRAVVKRELAADYKKHPVAIYFGNTSRPYRTPQAQQIGVTVDNNARLDAMDYPFWLRLVPTSLLWAHTVRPDKTPVYRYDQTVLDDYMKKELGQSCDVAPSNASLKVEKTKLGIVTAEAGGTCRLDDVRHQLERVTPKLDATTQVKVAVKERPPVITTDAAKQLRTDLEGRIKDGVAVTAGSETVTIPRDQLVTWLDFDSSGEAIVVKVNAERSAKYVAEHLAPKVARAAGVSKVSTMDFVETSRVNGPAGQAINTEQTLASLGAFLTRGDEPVQVAVRPVAPRVEYTRSYSPTDTGLSALLQQYAESHPGSFGISLIELSGQRRHASFNDTKQFRTASTYKLFVAYGTLKRVEAGTWRWSDQIQGGRTLEKCFDDMIVKSDNPCGEVLLQKIGFRALTDELKAAGLKNSSFLGKEPVTTAGDLSIFNAALESGQLVSPASRDRLIGAMKRNIFRQGVPAGANGTVANKVGFLEAYLHDAAIIYGPNGPVVLSVMTSGSSWATIADLTKQIEALRNR